jgi:hypothetical protein
MPLAKCYGFAILGSLHFLMSGVLADDLGSRRRLPETIPQAKCTDLPGWLDSDGSTCSDYTESGWCCKPELADCPPGEESTDEAPCCDAAMYAPTDGPFAHINSRQACCKSCSQTWQLDTDVTLASFRAKIQLCQEPRSSQVAYFVSSSPSGQILLPNQMHRMQDMLQNSACEVLIWTTGHGRIKFTLDSSLHLGEVATGLHFYDGYNSTDARDLHFSDDGQGQMIETSTSQLRVRLTGIGSGSVDSEVPNVLGSWETIASAEAAGCTSPAASNFDLAAVVDDGSCIIKEATERRCVLLGSTPLDVHDLTFGACYDCESLQGSKLLHTTCDTNPVAFQQTLSAGFEADDDMSAMLIYSNATTPSEIGRVYLSDLNSVPRTWYIQGDQSVPPLHCSFTLESNQTAIIQYSSFEGTESGNVYQFRHSTVVLVNNYYRDLFRADDAGSGGVVTLSESWLRIHGCSFIHCGTAKSGGGGVIHTVKSNVVATSSRFVSHIRLLARTLVCMVCFSALTSASHCLADRKLCCAV